MGRTSVLAVLGIAATLTAAVRTPEQASWEVLDTAGKCANTEVRLNAVAALETLGGDNPQGVKRLLVYLKSDKDARVRKAAALSLGRMKVRQAIPELRAALKDTNEVAFGAAQALVMLGDEAGRAMLVSVVQGTVSDTPGIMTNAYRDAERRFYHPMGTAIFGLEGAASPFIGPGYMGIEAITDTNSLRGKSEPGKIAAIQCLTKDPSPYAVTLLEWALSNPTPAVRAAAAKAVGQRGNPGSIAKLEPLLKDKRSEVRTLAAAAIIRLSQPPTVPAVPLDRAAAPAPSLASTSAR